MPVSVNSVSVLIPARGSAEYLERTILSLRNSILSPLEILIVDDGIDIDVIQKIKSINQDLPLKIIKSNGKGIVDALNTGLLASQGQFIARLDSDDIAFPQRFSVQVEYLNANKLCSAVGSQVVFIDENDSQIGASDYPVSVVSELSIFQKRCLVAHPSVMFRRSDAVEIGGYRSLIKSGDTDLAEDFDFWLRMANIGKIVNLDQHLTGYRIHANQVTRRFQGQTAVATLYTQAVNNFEMRRNRVVDISVVISEGDFSNSSFVYDLIKSQLSFINSLYFRMECLILFTNKNRKLRILLLSLLIKLVRKISLLN